jgi:negative regulator of sigma E activity
MKRLDDKLRNLLKRREPPDGFAERVLSRLKTDSSKRKLKRETARFWRRPVLRWAAAAVACLLVAIGIARYKHQQRVRAQAEQASRQAVLALEITRTELNTALEQAQRITVQALAAPQQAKTRME